MDTATETRIDAAKTASKRVVQKTAEATGDLIGNKKADKITSIGKPKEVEKIYIPLEKKQQIINDLDYFECNFIEHKMCHHCIKMDIKKIVTFLDTTSDDKDLPKCVTIKWIEVYDQSEGNYNVKKEIRIKTSMLRSDLCGFSDTYIVVKVTITVANPNGAKRNKEVTFKNNVPFINCILKINDVKIDNAEDLDVVMPMYNLLEYSKNYRKTTGSL